MSENSLIILLEILILKLAIIIKLDTHKVSNKRGALIISKEIRVDLDINEVSS